jgi:hypothetical protein
MFWTIVGALAFFFIVLPLIFEVLMQKWFWYLTGWLVLALFAFVIIPECSRDSQRRSFIEKQEALKAEQDKAQAAATALLRQQRAREANEASKARIAQEAERRSLQQQAANARRQQAIARQNDLRQRQEAERQKVDAQREAIRIKNEQLREELSGTIEIALAVSIKGEFALKYYLKTLQESEVKDLQGAMRAEELHAQGIGSDIRRLQQVREARQVIDRFVIVQNHNKQPSATNTEDVESPPELSIKQTSNEPNPLVTVPLCHTTLKDGKPKQLPGHYKTEMNTTLAKARLIRLMNPNWMSNHSAEERVRVYLEWYPEEKKTIIWIP